MMENLLLALAFCIFAPRLATAQEVKTPVVLERVTPSRAIPKGLRAFVPRGETAPSRPMEVAAPETPMILADTGDFVAL